VVIALVSKTAFSLGKKMRSAEKKSDCFSLAVPPPFFLQKERQDRAN